MAARTFEDSAGRVWEVFEVHRASAKPGAVSAGLEHGWLAFVNGAEKRRLAPIPAQWETLAVRELEELCARARAAVPRRSDALKGASPPADSPSVPALGESGAWSARPARVSGSYLVSETATDAVIAPSARESAAVESAVRAFAHEARMTGLPAIEAMVRLKAMLLQRFPGTAHVARDMRHVRRWFVEAYYFERNA